MRDILKLTAKILAILGVIALIITAGFLGNEIIMRFTAESIEIGNLDELEKSETVIASFDFGYDYAFKAGFNEPLTNELDPIQFNGTLHEYVVRLNDHACDVINIQNGRVQTVMTLLFYDIDGQVSGSCTFEIDIKFLSLGTMIAVTVTGSNDTALTYLNNYIYGNGLKFEVCQKEDFLIA